VKKKITDTIDHIGDNIKNYIERKPQPSPLAQIQKLGKKHWFFVGDIHDYEQYYPFIAKNSEIWDFYNLNQEVLILSEDSKDRIESIFCDYPIGKGLVRSSAFFKDKKSDVKEAYICFHDDSVLVVKNYKGQRHIFVEKPKVMIPDKKITDEMHYQIFIDNDGHKRVVDASPEKVELGQHKSVMDLGEKTYRRLKNLGIYAIVGVTNKALLGIGTNETDSYSIDVQHKKPSEKYPDGRIIAKTTYHGCITDSCIEKGCPMKEEETPISTVLEKFNVIDERLSNLYLERMSAREPEKRIAEKTDCERIFENYTAGLLEKSMTSSASSKHPVFLIHPPFIGISPADMITNYASAEAQNN